MIRKMGNVKLSVFHSFTFEEAEEEKQRLIRLYDDLKKKEEEKAEIMANLRQEIKSMNLSIESAVYHLSKNGKDKWIHADMYLDFETHQRVYRNSRGEIVKTLPFEDDDYNQPLPLITEDFEKAYDGDLTDVLPEVEQVINDGALDTSGVKVRVKARTGKAA